MPRKADHRVEFVPGNVERGLDSDALTDAEPRLPLFSDFTDHADHLVAHHHRTFGDIVGHALVSGSESDALVVAHADRIRQNLHHDAVFTRRFELDILQPQVARTVKPQRFSFHRSEHSFQCFSLHCPNRSLTDIISNSCIAVRNRRDPRLKKEINTISGNRFLPKYFPHRILISTEEPPLGPFKSSWFS